MGEAMEVDVVWDWKDASSSKVSRCRTKTLQVMTAPWRRVSPMPLGSDCQVSGLRSCVIRGKRASVKRWIVRVSANWRDRSESAGCVVVVEVEILDGSVSNVGERRMRWRQPRAWVRILRHGLSDWVTSVRNGGVQYAVHAVHY